MLPHPPRSPNLNPRKVSALSHKMTVLTIFQGACNYCCFPGMGLICYHLCLRGLISSLQKVEVMQRIKEIFLIIFSLLAIIQEINRDDFKELPLSRSVITFNCKTTGNLFTSLSRLVDHFTLHCCSSKLWLAV